MFVRFTLVANKQDIYIRADTILEVGRNPNNVLETVLVTNRMTPKGMAIYTVLEPPMEAAMAIDNALHGGQLSIVTH